MLDVILVNDIIYVFSHFLAHKMEGCKHMRIHHTNGIDRVYESFYEYLKLFLKDESVIISLILTILVYNGNITKLIISLSYFVFIIILHYSYHFENGIGNWFYIRDIRNKHRLHHLNKKGNYNLGILLHLLNV